jgi:hypothetical protein
MIEAFSVDEYLSKFMAQVDNKLKEATVSPKQVIQSACRPIP